MFFLFERTRLNEIILHYLGIDISFFTDYQIVVIGLLVGILTLLSCWFLGKLLYSIFNHFNH